MPPGHFHVPHRQQLPTPGDRATGFSTIPCGFQHPGPLPLLPGAGSIKRVVSPGIWPNGARCGTVRNDKQAVGTGFAGRDSALMWMDRGQDCSTGVAPRAQQSQTEQSIADTGVRGAFASFSRRRPAALQRVLLPGVDLSKFWRCKRMVPGFGTAGNCRGYRFESGAALALDRNRQSPIISKSSRKNAAQQVRGLATG